MNETRDIITDIINPNCHACNGTGIDSAFGNSCTECSRDSSLAQRRFDAPTNRADRVHTPGDRLDGRTFGGSTENEPTSKQIAFATRLIEERNLSIDLLAAEGSTKREMSGLIDRLLNSPVSVSDGPAVNSASDKQIAFITSLLADRDRSNERHAAECETIEMLIETGQMSRRAASPSIDLLKSIPRKRAEAEADAPVAGLDIRPLERFTTRGVVRFALPGVTNNSESSRLKVSIRFRRNGMIYVDDAAAYGAGRNYGRQAPGSAYRGDIVEALEAILADPYGALKAYAAITDRCGICNLPLEDEQSVERGVGPVCWQKMA